MTTPHTTPPITTMTRRREGVMTLVMVMMVMKVMRRMGMAMGRGMVWMVTRDMIVMMGEMGV